MVVGIRYEVYDEVVGSWRGIFTAHKDLSRLTEEERKLLVRLHGELPSPDLLPGSTSCLQFYFTERGERRFQELIRLLVKACAHRVRRQVCMFDVPPYMRKHAIVWEDEWQFATRYTPDKVELTPPDAAEVK